MFTLAATILLLAPEPVPPSGSATLVLFRRQAEPLLFKPTLSVDGVAIGRIGTNRYVAVALSPGTHRIEAHWPPLAGHKPATLTITTRQRSIGYVELTGTAAFWRTAATTALVERPAIEAEVQLGACCRPIR